MGQPTDLTTPQGHGQVYGLVRNRGPVGSIPDRERILFFGNTKGLRDVRGPLLIYGANATKFSLCLSPNKWIQKTANFIANPIFQTTFQGLPNISFEGPKPSFQAFPVFGFLFPDFEQYLPAFPSLCRGLEPNNFRVDIMARFFALRFLAFLVRLYSRFLA